jgi:hypothetical protein
MQKYDHESNFLDAIIQAELSAISKRVYLERWKVLLQEIKRDIYHILTHPDEYIPWFQQRFQSKATLKSYFSAVMAVFRHNPGLRDQEKESRTKWFEAFTKVNDEIEERYRNNEPTEKQKEVYVPFSDIVKARDTLESGSDERLLLSFYTYLPPLRCDFNRVRIYRATVPLNNMENNYIVLQPSASYLVLQEFKTQKHFSDYKKELPDDLVKELRKNLEKHPRDYLFTDRSGNPYLAKSYIQWANRVFAKALGKRMTISMVRHSFINSLDFNKLTIAEKEQIAKDMAHSVGTQDRYRLIF